MTSSQLTSMDRYYKGSPEKGFGYDYYLTKSNDTILLKNLQFSNLKANTKSLSITIKGNNTKGVYPYTINPPIKGGYTIKSFKAYSNTLFKGTEANKGITYDFSIQGFNPTQYNIKSDIKFRNIFYEPGITYSGGSDITFQYKGSTVGNKGIKSKNMYPTIKGNYLQLLMINASNIKGISDYISYVDKINYIYKGPTSSKSYTFYDKGNVYGDYNKSDQYYSFNMKANIQPNAYLYQEVILYKGIDYDGDTNYTSGLIKNNHHFWDDYINYQSKGIEKAIHAKGSLTMVPWDASKSEYDYYMSKGNDTIVLKDITYKGINITDFEITNIKIGIHSFGGTSKSYITKSYIPTKVGNSYIISYFKGESSTSIPKAENLKIKSTITYKGIGTTKSINVLFSKGIQNSLTKLQYIDYRFEFKNANIKNYNIDKTDIKAFITEENKASNLVALKAGLIPNDTIQSIEYYYSKAEDKGNLLTIFKGGSFNSNIIFTQNNTKFELTNTPWTVKSDYFLYQLVTINPAITNNEPYISTNTCTVKSTHDFWNDYIKSQSNGLEKAINAKGSLTMVPWDSGKSEYDYYMSKGNNIILLKGLEYKGIDHQHFNITKMDIQIYKAGDKAFVTNKKSLIPLTTKFDTFQIKSSNGTIKGETLGVLTSITYKATNYKATTIKFYGKNQIHFHKLQYIDYRFEFQNANIKNYNIDKTDIKAFITEENKASNLVALKAGLIPNDTIQSIEYYYSKAEDKGNLLTIFKGGSFNSNIIFTQNNTKFELTNTPWTVKSDYFLYQLVTINPAITNNEPYISTNTCTVKSTHDFWNDYIKSQSNGLEKAINAKGSLTMVPWDSGKSEYDYYMSKGNNIILLKGLEYKGIDHQHFNITKMDIQIYKAGDKAFVTNKKSLIPLTTKFDTFQIKSSNGTIKGETLGVLTSITYKATNYKATTIKFYGKNQNQITFHKLQYIDFRFDFQNAIIKNGMQNKQTRHLNPKITEANEELSLIALKSGKISKKPIHEIDYYYGEVTKIVNVFDGNNFKNNYINFNPPDYTINTNNNWEIDISNPVFQRVKAHPSITIDDANVKSNICITENDTFIATVPSPIYLKAINSNPTYKALTGESDFEIDISIFTKSDYTLHIGSSNDKGITSIGEINNVKSFTGITKGFKGTKSFNVVNYNYGTDKYMYSYVETYQIKRNNKKIYVKSELSNPVYIPINDIRPPTKIGYTNFWPYYFNVADSNKATVYGDFSGGPIEIYKGDDQLSTREGYIVYRDSLSSTNIKYTIPNILKGGDYFFVKGYHKETREIISLSDVDPFDTINTNNTTKSPKPIEFPNAVTANNIQIYNTNMFGSSSGILGRYEKITMKSLKNINILKSDSGYTSFNCSTNFCGPPKGVEWGNMTTALGTPTLKQGNLNSFINVCNSKKNCIGFFEETNVKTETPKAFYKSYYNLSTFDGIPLSIPPTSDCKCNNNAIYLKNYLLHSLLSFDINSSEYKASTSDNFLWSIIGSKGNFNFKNNGGGSISNCKSSYGSLFSKGDSFSIIDDQTKSISLSEIQYGKEYSIKSNVINKYLSTSTSDLGDGYCSLKSTKSMYASVYESTAKSKWIFKKTKATNTTLNVASWGYEQYGNAKSYFKTDNIIYNNDTKSNIDVSIREQEIDMNGSLIPYTKLSSSNSNHIKSSFVNFVQIPFYNTVSDVINLTILDSIAVKINESFLQYGVESENIYMMGIQGTNSIWCDKDGVTKGTADNLNNLISQFYGGINNQVYNFKGDEVNAISIQINDVEGQDYYNDIKSERKFYIKQSNIPYVDNTNQYDDTARKDTLTEINSDIKELSLSQSGCGGQLSTIYMNNDLSNIDNIFCIAGGGGGSGIYSAPSFKATKTIYNGHDGCALVKKKIKEIDASNQNSELKASMNYMDGGSCGVYSGDKLSDPLYEIPSGSLGGSVHTFKNLSVPINTFPYARPSKAYYGANYGFYPNFFDKNKDDNLIIKPPMNGNPFYSVKGNIIKYNGILYNVDSFGLVKSGKYYGNGGSAVDENIFTTTHPIIDKWGIKANVIDYDETYTKANYRNYTTYSQGGGGGGGFGGGSAGTYFFYQKGIAQNNTQQLNNVPPGGGGGGNSFYNVKHKGLTYGINSQHIKSNANPIPSILPQMLKLALPKKMKGFTNNEYLKGKQRMYMYIYTGKGSQKKL